MTEPEPLSVAAKPGGLTAGVGVPPNKTLYPSSTKVRIRIDKSKLGASGLWWGGGGVERSMPTSTVVNYPYALTLQYGILSLIYFILLAVIVMVI